MENRNTPNYERRNAVTPPSYNNPNSSPNNNPVKPERYQPSAPPSKKK